MDSKQAELVRAIGKALEIGQPARDAAIVAWQRVNDGRRTGLNAALLQLIDEGILEAVVTTDSRSRDRTVGTIVSVNQAAKAAKGNATPLASPTPSTSVEKSRTVFVVHGRDTALRNAMFQFLRAIDLYPLDFLELTATLGTGTPYVGELLETAFERAQAIVVMMTPDEEVRLSPRLGGGEDGHQARPNVIFEAGLALARNPARTIIVEIGSVRSFSDIGGRHIVRLDDADPAILAKRQNFAQLLAQAGCAVSLAGIDWHTAGRFEVRLG